MLNNSELMSTQIYIAEVEQRVDPGFNGIFQARIGALGPESHPINYTSPYASNNEGAIVAIPEVGTQVLVCRPSGSDELYYLGATFAPEPDEASGNKVKEAVEKPMVRVDPYIYRADGTPHKYLFAGPKGSRFVISEEETPNFINSKISTISAQGKQVRLNDSPSEDAIVIDSNNGSKITVSNDPQNNSVPSRAVQIETAGPQNYLNTGDQTNIHIQDGKELQILNDSTGMKAPAFEPNKAGNVNIQSLWKDVNVFSKGIDGRIFIECLNPLGEDQLIEIETNGVGGAIRIKTNGKVDISGAQGIGVESLGNIDIKGANVNIEATNNMNLKAGNSLKEEGGTEIQLNPPSPVPSANPDIGSAESHYGNTGITTYSIT